jgi:hypothetical protein
MDLDPLTTWVLFGFTVVAGFVGWAHKRISDLESR